MFKGSFVALVTPMDGAGGIDFDALQTLVAFHINSGTDGLVIGGTTGESASLSTGEFSELISVACSQVASKIPVVAGTGSANTQKTIFMTNLAADLGADAALVVTPYYVRPMQNGLLAHFTAVADCSNIPLLMYNVPARTSVDMLATTTAKLAEHEMIVGIKEALPDMQRISSLIELCPPEFDVLSGDDPSCKDAMLAGARGVISVAANVEPRRLKQLCQAALEGNRSISDTLHKELSELFALLGVESNPIPVKWAVAEMGLIKNGIRLPLLPLEQCHHNVLRECLNALQGNLKK
ncbi:MAG: 4-hydroxy-tetrahydrodipicolinate synthase [Lysobacterales bacterium]|jgi:4-hydroxy-tetrahydrodipicolinate synthase